METNGEHERLPLRLGLVLKRARELNGMKQGPSAESAGLSGGMLSRWEQGDLKKVDLVKLSRLAELYDTSLTEIFRLVEGAPADNYQAVQNWLAGQTETTT